MPYFYYAYLLFLVFTTRKQRVQVFKDWNMYVRDMKELFRLFKSFPVKSHLWIRHRKSILTTPACPRRAQIQPFLGSLSCLLSPRTDSGPLHEGASCLQDLCFISCQGWKVSNGWGAERNTLLLTPWTVRLSSWMLFPPLPQSSPDKQVLLPASPQVVPVFSSFSSCPTKALESNFQKCQVHATVSEVKKVGI